MLEKDKNDERLKRHKDTQEDFTPESVLPILLPGDRDELYHDFNLTFLDPSFGIGNIIIGVYSKRLKNVTDLDGILCALSSLYGTELMGDNVYEFQTLLLGVVHDKLKELGVNPKTVSKTFLDQLNSIIEHNFVCTDAFDWNYEKWCKKTIAQKMIETKLKERDKLKNPNGKTKELF